MGFGMSPSSTRSGETVTAYVLRCPVKTLPPTPTPPAVPEPEPVTLRSVATESVTSSRPSASNIGQPRAVIAVASAVTVACAFGSSPTWTPPVPPAVTSTEPGNGRMTMGSPSPIAGPSVPATA